MRALRLGRRACDFAAHLATPLPVASGTQLSAIGWSSDSSCRRLCPRSQEARRRLPSSEQIAPLRTPRQPATGPGRGSSREGTWCCCGGSSPPRRW
eukprot:1690999-Rhodomonas_salina.2